MTKDRKRKAQRVTWLLILACSIWARSARSTRSRCVTKVGTARRPGLCGPDGGADLMAASHAELGGTASEVLDGKWHRGRERRARTGNP